MPRLFVTAACAAVMAIAAGAPALAQTRPETRIVYYGDLNLDSPAGADALIRRVEQASDVVCGDRPGPQTLSEHASVGDCEVTTTQYAIEDIGNPMVLGRYYGHTPEVVVEGSWDPDEQYYPVKSAK